MSDKPKKLFTPLGIAIDLILTAGFFLFFFTILQSFVPAESTVYRLFWAGMCSFCLTGVFWIALCMFRAVLMDEINGESDES